MSDYVDGFRVAIFEEIVKHHNPSNAAAGELAAFAAAINKRKAEYHAKGLDGGTLTTIDGLASAIIAKSVSDNAIVGFSPA